MEDPKLGELAGHREGAEPSTIGAPDKPVRVCPVCGKPTPRCSSRKDRFQVYCSAHCRSTIKILNSKLRRKGAQRWLDLRGGGYFAEFREEDT